MPRINVEQKALTDSRFHRLGIELGAPPKFAHRVGLASMVAVWNECIESGRYSIEPWAIDAALGETDASEMLVRAKLGVKVANGLIRVRGTRGRIEYLEQKRRLAQQNGKKGGRPKKPTLVSTGTDVAIPRETLPAPVPALALKTQTEPPNPHRAPRSGLLYTAGFLRAWGAYPHYALRSKKPKAWEVWRKQNLEPLTDSVLAWIDAGRRTEDWKRDEGQFVTGMQVWLKDRDFTDPPTVHEPIRQPDRPVLSWDRPNRVLTPDEIRKREAAEHAL